MENTAMRLQRLFIEQRPQTPAEEIANSISHGLGFLLAVAALPVLLRSCAERGGQAADLLAAGVFAATMILVYLVSAIYHALPMGHIKALFNRIDHAAIYLFIAGSYTPFAIGAIRDGLGWTLFGVVWTLAMAGALAKLLNRLYHPLWSTALYIIMGWSAVFAAGPLLQQVSHEALVLLIAGGIAYTVGAVAFVLDSRVRYAHFIWHLFVMAGSTCHFLAALKHAA